jgi:hypothetical protein
MRLPDIQTALRAGRTEGKVISQVISQVVRWINLQPAVVGDRDNNKPPLWRDFIPALEATVGSEAEALAQTLQREIFRVVRQRLDSFDGNLEGDVGQDSYLERFSSPIWNELLVLVHHAAGPRFQGLLAPYNTDLPPRLPSQSAPALTRDLSRAISRLPQISGNPALGARPALDELMRLISPVVIQWAVQHCERALTAQGQGRVPPWPPSVLERVRVQHEVFCEFAPVPPPVQPQEGADGPPRPRQSPSTQSAGVVSSVESPAPSLVNSTDVHPLTVATSNTQAADGTDSVLTSLSLDELDLKLRRKALRQTTGALNRAARAGASETSWTPLITTMDRVKGDGVRPQEKTAARASWMSRPVARTNRG